MANPLRQETILPFHAHSNIDIVSRPGAASGELGDKYPRFKAQEFTIELSQTSKNIETYHICREITTVPEVLEEWRYGLKGRDAIQTMNHKFGGKWKYRKDKFIYESRRGVVKAYMHLVLTEGRSNTEAIEHLEQERGMRSIATLYNELKKTTEKGKTSSVYGEDEPEYAKGLVHHPGRVLRPPPIKDTAFPLPVRRINSIPNIWEEWEVGWKGERSVKSLIGRYRMAWKNPRFKSYENHFRYRNQLVRTIYEAVKQKVVASQKDAIQALEDIRGTREPSTFCKSEKFKSLLRDEWKITTAVEEYWKCGQFTE